MRSPALLALLSLTCACGPTDQSGTVRAWLFERNAETNGYALKVGEVEHLESLRELRGRDIEIRRGTGIEETLSAPNFEADVGGPFALEYGLDDAGAVVPGDLHSFHALTMYRHLDRVATLLRAHGHQPSQKLKVFYLPRYDNTILGDSRLLLTDNAAYFSPVRGFLIVPSFVLSELPMLLNEGVLAHEFGHAVVHQEMFGEAGEEPFAKETSARFVVLSRHLISMHEGVADIIGFAATGDPNYILPTADVDRDMAEPRDMTAADREGLESTAQVSLLDVSSFDPHYQGSLLARAVYEAWPKVEGRISEGERGRMIDYTLASLRVLDYQPVEFTFVSFLNAFLRQMPSGERADACAVYRKRLAPMKDEFTNCRGTP